MWKRPSGYFPKNARLKGKLDTTEVEKRYAHGQSLMEIAKADGTTKGVIASVLERAAVKRRPAHRLKCYDYAEEAKKCGVANQTYLRFCCLKFLKAVCVKCGNSDPRVLQINHIGDKMRKLNMSDMQSILRGECVDVDVRCANCNVIYEHEKGRMVNHAVLFRKLGFEVCL